MIEVLPIFGESAAAVDPTDGAFNNPAFGQNDKALDPVGTFDDFRFEARQDGRQRRVKDWPLIGAVGKQLLEKWEHPEQGR